MNDQPAPARRLPFWLVLSVLANMLLIGLMAGILLRPGPPGPQMDRRHEHFSWVSKEDKGDREVIMRVLREAFRSAEGPREARTEARKVLADAMTAEPYDEQAVLDAFENLRAADAAVNVSAHQAMAKLFADLSPEERARMARFLMRGPRGMDGRKRSDARGGPPPDMPGPDGGPDAGPEDGADMEP